MLLLFLISCKTTLSKDEVNRVLGVEEANDWILVIHPAGCRTCLDQLYQTLSELELTGGAIVIVAKNSKTLRMSAIFEQSPVPLYLDEQRVLLKKGLIKYQDQLLLFSGGSIKRYEIMEYLLLVEKLKEVDRLYSE
ncbi:hypothetical protein [Algoriphagus sp. Y33]|uniref:hypothetical protein n=1 Tax=Algoriphagus sp. Y33 TaxID=2772483 RepID=UPI00177C92CD|nr:hypothetical protein [Algoriphagus sp. Y33]